MTVGPRPKLLAQAHDDSEFVSQLVFAVSRKTLPFGRYQGRTLGEVLAIDERYLRWLASHARDRVLRVVCELLVEMLDEPDLGVVVPELRFVFPLEGQPRIESNVTRGADEARLHDWIDSHVSYAGLLAGFAELREAWAQ